MRIYDCLKAKCKNSDNPVIKKLHTIAEDVVEKIIPHLKQITHELPEFDIHDETHSQKVLENIEKILGDKVGGLSAYELFFIYLSSYLHDAAMALPDWERKLLKLTEGQENFYHNDVEKPLLYDGKPPMKLSEAKEYIIKHKEQIYGNLENFEERKKYLLSFKTEEELINDLSEQLSEYQNYRNGYIHRLNEAKSEINEYLKLSDEIRYEYIRENHSIRIEKLINNLSAEFDAKLDIKIGKKLTKTLGVICKSHGESYDFVKELGFEDTYFGDGSVNTQFLCMMLRIGDILHFSYDRAPDSLYAEKMISSVESRKQWKIKSQGVINSIVSSDGIVRIKYDAFCDVPSFYYYLNDYILWIEGEISNYNKMIKVMSQNTEFSKMKSRYEINISDSVDKKGLKYDEDVFEPVSDLCFKLNQSKILELLMGTNLYKDKFLCLRELYQNAMDTCRNMMCYNPEYNGYIEFGIDEEIVDGVNRKFLYCMDNGMGMTVDIINKYFLNIGNSYYRSKDFYRENAKNGNGFMPTSQFGIGVLSCFMISNKIYVATKHRSDNAFTRFMIDGPHEKFYYVKENKFDDKENKINEHGTIIKLYLKEDILLNDNVISYFDVLALILNKNKDNIDSDGDIEKILKEYSKERICGIENNLLYIMQSFIGYSKEDISLQIKLKDDNLYHLMLVNTLLIDLRKFLSDEQINKMISYRFYRENRGKKQSGKDSVIDYGDMDILRIFASYDGIEYKNTFALPKVKTDFNFSKNNAYAVHYSIQVDGIDIKVAGKEIEDILRGGKDFYNVKLRGTFDFAGEIRPQLSVDRDSITFISDAVRDGLSNLKKAVAIELLKAVKNHIIKNNIEFNSDISKNIWKFIFNSNEWINKELVDEIRNSTEIEIYLDEINEISISPISIKEFIECDEYSYKIWDMGRFTTQRFPIIIKYIILNKIINSSNIILSDDIVNLKKCKFTNAISTENLDLNKISLKNCGVVVSIDELYGKYCEYDIVNYMYPIIKEEIYNKLINKEIKEYSKKIKVNEIRFNSMVCLGNHLKACMIYPDGGIFFQEEGIGTKFEFLYKFRTDDLFEEYPEKITMDYIIYAFVCPANLDDTEREEIERFKIVDKEYYDGVINGWSILFLGSTGQTIVLPGIVSKRNLLKKISDKFFVANEGIEYYLLDGTHITAEYIEKL